MEIVSRFLLLLYATLMFIAITVEMRHEQDVNRVYIALVLIFSLVTAWASIFNSVITFAVVGAVGVVGFQLLAIYAGIDAGNFHLKHHLVRLIISLMLLGSLWQIFISR
ncbi:hypothetical protein FO433_06675 [Weissella cibaria]|uniref:hypothetical protein n=1 Tax=Weissella cibaria TaxID=137591 RepID=UPI0011960A47|nr:hypothetical protein [Weissella cibaria]MCS9987765.1 hypothetical protein [Weissella cibaria]TVV25456.1 hypothetical protein FO433_06675 [Weissella cibaria]